MRGFLICLLLTPLVAGQAFSQTPTVPAGSEFQVSSGDFEDENTYPAIAADADGNFVVVWSSKPDFGESTVLGQRYTSDGTPRGDQFQVSTYTTLGQYDPAVAVAPDGDFLVVWRWRLEDDLFGKLYSSDGAPVGDDFVINAYTRNTQSQPAVAADSEGNFIVVWFSDGSDGGDTSAGSIQGQRFAPDGGALGDQFQVNTYTTSFQFTPSVDVGPGDEFVVVWTSNGSAGADTDEFGILAQRYASDGTPVGGEIQVNTYTTDDQMNPSVGVGPDGDFVVAWTSFDSAYGDTDGMSVQGQRFGSEGGALGAQFQVNTYTTDDQAFASVAVDLDGDVVVAWMSDGDEVKAQRYTSDGTPLAGEFEVNTVRVNSPQEYPAPVAMGPDGDFVVVWQSAGQTGFFTIQGQRFRASADVAGRAFIDANFNGVQDPSESGLADVPVDLFKEGGDLVGSTMTDAEGAFLLRPKIGLTGLVDRFFLEFDSPDDFVFTLNDVGTDDTADSDADRVTGQTPTVEILAAGDQVTDLDAGLFIPTIEGRVWNDDDGNGIQDGGELGIADIAVELYDSLGGLVASTVTTAEGLYFWGELDPGAYYMQFTAPGGFVFTAQNQGSDDAIDSDVNPASGTTPLFTDETSLVPSDAGLEVDSDLDGVADRVDNCPDDVNADQADGDGDGVGDVCDPATIGDRVWLDANLNGVQDGGEAGFEGVTVELFTSAGVSLGTTLSAADGSYSFTDLAGGAYYL
ncbi:MAG: SdrD B-like domain-containing protein, partial [Acidobacteriota bacterium]